MPKQSRPGKASYSSSNDFPLLVLEAHSREVSTLPAFFPENFVLPDVPALALRLFFLIRALETFGHSAILFENEKIDSYSRAYWARDLGRHGAKRKETGSQGGQQT